MTSLKCSECGSTEFVKQNGLYVCQYCGTSIKPEQATIVHNTINMKDSTVIIDDGYDFDKTSKLIMSSIEGERFEEASKYAKKVLEHNPDDDGAYFLMITTNLSSKTIEKISSSDGSSLSSACDHIKRQMKEGISPDQEVIDVGRETVSDMLFLSCMRAWYDAYRKYMEPRSTRNQAEKLIRPIENLLDVMITTEKNIDLIIDSESRGQIYKCMYITTIWIRNGVKWVHSTKNDTFSNIVPFNELVVNKAHGVYDKVVPIVKTIDPSYTIESFEKKGCYIATSVYGSYDCPQVWTLRRYRDNVLASSWYGRVFIKLYYSLSPSVVKYFGHMTIFTKLFRPMLDSKVKKLNNKGFSDQPYDDKDW